MALKQWLYEKGKEIVLCVFKLTRKTKSKTNLSLLPSPPKLPLIGNLHQLGTLPHRSLRDLSLKYGDIMLLQLGHMQNPTVVVSSMDVAMEIMKTHDLAFSSRPQNTAAKILLYGCIDIAFGVYGESWSKKKKICVEELLNPKMVQSVHKIREEEVAKLVNKLREVSSSDKCYMNMREMLMSTSNNIVCKCALGRKYTGDGYSRVKELARNVMVQLSAFTVRDYFPLLGWVDVLTGKIQEFKAIFHALDALFDQAIAEHLMEGDHSKNKDFLDILLQLQENNMLTKNDLKALLMAKEIVDCSLNLMYKG
ncbi:Cytochrome P450 71A20, partial [Mucuna pruriens]